MSVSMETIAKAYSQVASQRIASGEPRYRAKMLGKYIGCNDRLVKSKQSALRMFCDDVTVWAKQVNVYAMGYDELEQVYNLIELELV